MHVHWQKCGVTSHIHRNIPGTQTINWFDLICHSQQYLTSSSLPIYIILNQYLTINYEILPLLLHLPSSNSATLCNAKPSIFKMFLQTSNMLFPKFLPHTPASTHKLSSWAPVARCKVSVLNLNHYRIFTNLLFTFNNVLNKKT